MKYFWDLPKLSDKELFDQIIESRNISKTQLEKYLYPNFFKDQNDPRNIGGVMKSIKRIKKALDNNENIGIFCDYDADGIPAGAMLFRAFSKFNKNIFTFIPTRAEGYGISQKSLNFYKKNNCSLVVAVDVGITAKDIACKYKKEKIDLIIIDHHLIIDDLYPKSAHCVIDLKKKSEKYPYKEFSAGGLVWKVLYAMHLEYGLYTEVEIKWILDLAAISTISDMVPMTGENWLISKFGLIVLSKTKNIGLKQLIETSSLDQNKIDEYNVGFQIGPRLNASGRMADPIDSYNLLIENDKENVCNLSKKLEKNNLLRQSQMHSAFLEAQSIIERDITKINKIIIVSSPNWQEGILGLVASKIVDKYHLPAMVFKEKKDIFVGSVRSIEGFDVKNAMEINKKNIESFGGHKMAAGLKVNKKVFEKFKKEMILFAKNSISEELFRKKIKIDAISDDILKINLKLYRQIEKLRPFGESHKTPVVMLQSVKLSDIRAMGKDKNHLSFVINDKLRAIYFNCVDKLDSKILYNICGNLVLNTWGGKMKVEFKVIDLGQSGDAVCA